MSVTRIASADQLRRARDFAATSGHPLNDALDIIIEHDRKVVAGKARGQKAGEAMKAWATIPIHGLIPITDQAAMAQAEILGYAEELLTGKAGAASEDKVEQEIFAYLFLKGATFVERLVAAGQPIKAGQLLVHKTSQRQRPLGMTKGLSDLLITRHRVWPGWYCLELKARAKNGKVGEKAEITPEQEAQADVGLITLGWHTLHAAVMLYTLDQHFGGLNAGRTIQGAASASGPATGRPTG